MVKEGRTGQCQWIETHKKPYCPQVTTRDVFFPGRWVRVLRDATRAGSIHDPTRVPRHPSITDDRNVDAPENLNLCSEVTLAASAEKERKHFCLVADLERRMNTLFFATSAQVRSGEHSTTDLTIVSVVFSNGVTEACACGC